MSNAPQMPGPAVSEWWEDEHAMLRHTGDLLAAELSALRPGRPLPRPLPWHAGLQLQQDLGADSLELMQLSSALAMALSPHDGGPLQQLHALPTVGQWAAAARDSLRRQSGKFGFATSGSTGRASYCVHDAPLLWQEVAALARLLPGRRRILCAVPAHHLYGFLFSILLPRALGLSGVPVVDLRASAPAALAGQLRSGDLVVAHPLYWSGVSDSGAALPGDVLGVSSGAPCPAQVAQALRAQSLATLMEVYGSSETAGVGWRTQRTRHIAVFRGGVPPLTAPAACCAPCPTARCATIRRRTGWNGSVTTASAPWDGSTTRCRSAASMCFPPMWPAYSHAIRACARPACA